MNVQSPLESEDDFLSVTWDSPSTAPTASTSAPTPSAVESDDPSQEDDSPAAFQTTRSSAPAPGADWEDEGSKWDGWLDVRIVDYKKELEGGKESHVTFGVEASSNLPTLPPQSKVRRRFQDFVFLHNNLAKDFPACVVPPLPDKHRIEYLPGRDRFGAEFLEKRVEDLQRFLTRLSRHPTLRRASLFSSFLEAHDWTIKMHRHLANPPGPDAPATILESVSDSILNLTSGKVRKPDERFEEMRETLSRFEYELSGVEKGVGRVKTRMADLSNDYKDLSQSIKGLAFLESGITEPLNHFSSRLSSFSSVLATQSTAPLPPLLSHLQSLLQYSQTHRDLLALRDQKQLDSEVLSEYLTGVVLERDRLASLVETGGVAAGQVGLGTYLKDKVDALRGRDDVGSRRDRMRRLDVRIKELQDAVTSSVETSTAFSDETLREHAAFELDKKEEMKELLGEFADAQIELYRKAMDDWDQCIPVLSRIRVDV